MWNPYSFEFGGKNIFFILNLKIKLDDPSINDLLCVLNLKNLRSHECLP